MEFSNSELDILEFGLEDHLVMLERQVSFRSAHAIWETKELISRIEHEKIRRGENADRAANIHFPQ